MHRYSYLFISTIPLYLSLILSACDNESTHTGGPRYATSPNKDSNITYRLAIHPLHNPKRLLQAYQPLVDYLNKNLNGVHFELEASRDYQAYETKFRAREPEFILPNPWQTLEAIKVGYTVIAMAGDADDFKGIFIIRKDSPIREIADLKGKVVSYPSQTALAASIMPQYYLHTNGIDINKDIENSYVGSQESAIMNAYLKLSDIGVTWPPPWRLFQQYHPDEAAELSLIWETPPLMNNSVMARDDIPDAACERVQQLLLELSNTEDGQAILNSMSTSKFYPASNASYEPVQQFIDRFEEEVRPVEQK